MNEKRNIKQKINLFIGSIGAFIGVAVFVAYIPQIMANLEGHKAQPWQPLFAAGSCLIWVVYGQFGRGSFRILNFYYFALKLLVCFCFAFKSKNDH